MDNMHSTNNIEDLRLSNLRKDPVAKFRGGGTGSGDKSKKCYRNSSSRGKYYTFDFKGHFCFSRFRQFYMIRDPECFNLRYILDGSTVLI